MASVDYTKFAYSDVLSDLKKLAAGAESYYSSNGDEMDSSNKQALDFFRSSTGYIVASMLAHTCDVNNHYIKKAFMETFGETSSNRKAKLIYARDHGYSIKRPLPAEMTYEPVISGTVKQISDPNHMTITIPAKTVFAINGVSLVSKYTCSWNLDAAGRQTIADGYQGKNVLMEGAIISRTFYSDGSTFLRYTIEDTGFSDLFGDRDPISSFISTNDTESMSASADGRITTLSVAGKVWNIDRRTMATNNKNTCLVRTDNNDYVELMFGDGTIANTPSGVVSVSYMTTNGANGNLSNIADLEITVSDSDAVKTNGWNIIGKTNITFIANSDLTNGTDTQSDNSIIYSAQSSFASFDRNVSLTDHQAYMSGLAPSIQYSDVYGEEQIVKWAAAAAGNLSGTVPQEVVKQIQNEGIQDSLRYANCMIFVALKNLYKSSGSGYTITQPDEYRLTGYSDKHITSQFFNEFIKVPPSYNNPPYSGEVGILKDGLTSRGMVTASYLYSMPKVHKYNLNYSINVESSYNMDTISQSTTNAIYRYLIDNTSFCTPVRRSDIIAAIMSISGVNNCIIRSLAPSATTSTGMAPIYTSSLSIKTGTTSASFLNGNDYIDESSNSGYSVSTYIDLCAATHAAYMNIQSINGLHGTDLLASANSMSAVIPNLPSAASSSTSILTTSQAIYYNSAITYSAYTGDGITSSIPSLSTIYDEYVVTKVVKNMFNTMVAPFICASDVSGYAPKSIYDMYNKTEGSTTDQITNLNLIYTVYAAFINWAAAFRIDTNYYTAAGIIDEYGDLSNFKGSHEIIQVAVNNPGTY